MPRLKRLSAREILEILHGFGFDVVCVRGSQAKLRREVGDARQILTLPLHRRLAPGTVHAIYRQALRFIPEPDLRPRFFGSD